MSEEKHTPLPWSLGKNGRSVIKEVPGIADGYDNYMIAVMVSHSLLAPSETKENAALIVSAVNSHAGFVAALEEAQAVVEVWKAAPRGVSFGSFMERALSKLDAAIAIAKIKGDSQS